MLATRPLLSIALLGFLLPVPALAADNITGVVTNGTTKKPSAGDDVVLIRLQQGMQETTRTKTDSRGHFSLEVPDDDMHLVRVTHEKANYFQPVTPGTHSITVDVYEAAAKVDGVSTSVEELHLETAGSQLHIVQVLEVNNQAAPPMTQFGPNGFEFYLPPDAHVERAGAMRDGLPVPASAAPLSDPGHYSFLFPIRPGETQFGIFYSLPYSGKVSIPLRFASDIETVAIVLPTSMTLTPGSSSGLAQQQPASGGTQTWTLHQASAAKPIEFSVSGTGELPKQNAPADTGSSNGQPLPETQNTMPGRGLQNPLDPEGNRDPWAQYKWWILGGLALLLAAGAGVMLRKSPQSEAVAASNVVPPALTPKNREDLLSQALKEELFALETDRLQNRITEDDYRDAKAALELILRRSLNRSQPDKTPENPAAS